MSRKLAFKEADVLRALKAAKRAGYDVGRFEVDQAGKIVVFQKDGQSSAQTADQALDDWLATEQARHARSA